MHQRGRKVNAGGNIACARKRHRCTGLVVFYSVCVSWPPCRCFANAWFYDHSDGDTGVSDMCTFVVPGQPINSPPLSYFCTSVSVY